MDELLAAARSLACQQAIYRFYAALDAADFAAVFVLSHMLILD